MSTARKKVVVRQFGGEGRHGYLPASGLGAGDEAELLLPDGRVQSCALRDVKYVAYVREFRLNDHTDPECIGPRTFASRPRGGGVWVQLRFADEDQMEGLMLGSLAFLDTLLLERGLFLDPPDKRGNTQRLFVPRTALIGFEILGMAGTLSRARPKPPEAPDQGDLFGEAAGSS